MYKFVATIFKSLDDELNTKAVSVIISIFYSFFMIILFAIGTFSGVFEKEWYPFILPVNLFFVVAGGIISIILLDAIIDFSTKFVTEGESRNKYYITTKLISGYQDEFVNDDDHPWVILAGPNIYLAAWISIIWTLALFIPVLWYVIGAVIVYFAFLLLVRHVLRISKKLNQHMKDPKAHEKVQENNKGV